MMERPIVERTLRVGLRRRAYDIVIRRGALKESGKLLAEAFSDAKNIILITNTKVGPLYVEEVRAGIEWAGADVNVIDVPVGERYKSLKTAAKLYGRLLELGADRSSAIVALGGGVIGDLAGFVAATYMRGIPFAQIPTSLLAQVDSSVGGKTAVNHPQAKNIIGAFYQPKLVIIDPDVLTTLPPREFRAGLSEIIKYAFIAGGELAELIRAGLPFTDREALVPVIAECCAYKARIVEKDERDQGVRAVLNYGHTIGHAIEAVAGYQRYNHGEAIAVGMIGAALVGERMGLISSEEVRVHRELIRLAGLPESARRLDPKTVYEHLKLDKKRVGGRDRMVLLEGLGRPEVFDVQGELIREAIEAVVEGGA